MLAEHENKKLTISWNFTHGVSLIIYAPFHVNMQILPTGFHMFVTVLVGRSLHTYVLECYLWSDARGIRVSSLLVLLCKFTTFAVPLLRSLAQI